MKEETGMNPTDVRVRDGEGSSFDRVSFDRVTEMAIS
jgi:hypothetical protein